MAYDTGLAEILRSGNAILYRCTLLHHKFIKLAINLPYQRADSLSFRTGLLCQRTDIG